MAPSGSPSMILFALVAAVQPAAVAPPAAAPVPAPPAEAAPQDVPGVTVTARRIPHTEPITVTGASACPEPDPAHYAADSDPKVVDSYPRQGAAAPPGLIQVRVSFDAPMSCYAEVTTQGGDADPCEPLGVWTVPDRRSFLLRCRLQPGAAYVFKFRRDQGRGFVGLSGRDAEPYVLHFATTDAPPTTNWPQALVADPGPPGAVATRGYVTCADVRASAQSDDCRRQRFGAPAAPVPPASPP